MTVYGLPTNGLLPFEKPDLWAEKKIYRLFSLTLSIPAPLVHALKMWSSLFKITEAGWADQAVCSSSFQPWTIKASNIYYNFEKERHFSYACLMKIRSSLGFGLRLHDLFLVLAFSQSPKSSRSLAQAPYLLKLVANNHPLHVLLLANS